VAVVILATSLFVGCRVWATHSQTPCGAQQSWKTRKGSQS